VIIIGTNVSAICRVPSRENRLEQGGCEPHTLLDGREGMGKYLLLGNT